MKKRETYIVDKLLWYLANLYYDRQHFSWRYLEDMAITLHQNAYLNKKFNPWDRRLRKNFEKMSLYLMQIVEIIKKSVGESQTISEIFIDEKMHFMTLGEMDGRGHAPCYNSIAEISFKMRDCIKDKTFIDAFIRRNAVDLNEIISEMIVENSFHYSLIKVVKNEFNVLNYFLRNGDPEDIFRQFKKFHSLLLEDKRLKKNEELMNSETQELICESNKETVEQWNSYLNNVQDTRNKTYEKATFVLEQLKILLSNTTNPEKKQYIEECIFNLETSIIASTPQTFEQDVRNGEELLRSFTIN